MNSDIDFGCMLCGNLGKEVGMECSECHAQEHSIGYVYSEEYDEFRLLVKHLVIAFLAFGGSLFGVYLWMIMKISDLGY